MDNKSYLFDCYNVLVFVDTVLESCCFNFMIILQDVVGCNSTERRTTVSKTTIKLNQDLHEDSICCRTVVLDLHEFHLVKLKTGN